MCNIFVTFIDNFVGVILLLVCQSAAIIVFGLVEVCCLVMTECHGIWSQLCFCCAVICRTCECLPINFSAWSVLQKLWSWIQTIFIFPSLYKSQRMPLLFVHLAAKNSLPAETYVYLETAELAVSRKCWRHTF